jgi:hypothetical protein
MVSCPKTVHRRQVRLAVKRTDLCLCGRNELINRGEPGPVKGDDAQLGCERPLVDPCEQPFEAFAQQRQSQTVKLRQLEQCGLIRAKRRECRADVIERHVRQAIVAGHATKRR